MSVLRPFQGLLQHRLALLVLLFSTGPVAAWADTINVGYISFDAILAAGPNSPGTVGFDIFNLAGNPAVGGDALPPDFPVFTALLLQNLTLNYSVGGTLHSVGLPNLAPGGYSPAAAQQFADSTVFSSATLTGNLNVSTFALSDGTVWQASSTAFTASILPSSGMALAPDVDLALISVNAQPASATPEPATIVLVFLSIPSILSRKTRLGSRRK